MKWRATVNITVTFRRAIAFFNLFWGVTELRRKASRSSRAARTEVCVVDWSAGYAVDILVKYYVQVGPWIDIASCTSCIAGIAYFPYILTRTHMSPTRNRRRELLQMPIP